MQQKKQNNHQPTTTQNIKNNINRQPHKTPHTQKHETNEPSRSARQTSIYILLEIKAVHNNQFICIHM